MEPREWPRPLLYSGCWPPSLTLTFSRGYLIGQVGRFGQVGRPSGERVSDLSDLSEPSDLSEKAPQNSDPIYNVYLPPE